MHSFWSEILIIIRGADLRSMRLDANLSTSQAAKIVGVKTRQTYESWERENAIPNVNQFVALCEGCMFSATVILALAIKRENASDTLDLSLASRRPIKDIKSDR
jgi:DNA-binding XRE family transcriptional regulator